MEEGERSAASMSAWILSGSIFLFWYLRMLLRFWIKGKIMTILLAFFRTSVQDSSGRGNENPVSDFKTLGR
jgi:hypothetical protein